MSNLKTLVCTLLFAVTSWTASTAVADHGWQSNQNSSCGRSGGYLNNSNPGYRPPASSNGYGVQTTPQNFGYSSYRVGGHAGNGNGNYLPNRSFDPRLGANSPAYRNAGRTGNLVYDSVHGDYHTVPQQYHGNFSGRARNRYQNNSPGFGGNSGW